MDDKEKKKGWNLDSFRLEPDELKNPVRREYVYERIHRRGRPLWVDIMIGIVAAVLVIWMMSFAFITGSAWLLAQSANKVIEETRVREIQTQQLRLEEQRQQERLRQLNTPQCRFWTDHYHKNRDQRSLDNMRLYCPQ